MAEKYDLTVVDTGVAATEEGTERLLGAHVLGPDAEEVINLFAAARRLGLTAGQSIAPSRAEYASDGANLAYMLG